MEKNCVYVVVEEFNNDGELEIKVLGVFTDIKKANARMLEQLEEYKEYECFNSSAFDAMEIDETSLFIWKENDDYYGKISITKEDVM